MGFVLWLVCCFVIGLLAGTADANREIQTGNSSYVWLITALVGVSVVGALLAFNGVI